MHWDDLTAGAILRHLVPGTDVTVVKVEVVGERVAEVIYRDARGRVDSVLVYPDEAERLEVVAGEVRLPLDADPALFRLVSEAQRLRWAYLFDPYLAVTTSLLEPLPHQITAVYGEMLPRQPLRYLLADDPGAGKTIMAGLLIKELQLRGDVQRCLVVCPGSLAEQWQEELDDRFGLPFEVLTAERFRAARTGNAFLEVPFLIARLDQLSRREDWQAALRATDWDLIVVDEAHKMSAAYYGTEVKETQRYQLGQLLSTVTRHYLLLTATPHDGKEEDFQLFLALLDGDRFAGRFRDGIHTVDTQDLMRRLVKEQLYRFDGTPLFPERRAYTVAYTLSEGERALYQAVTAYVREQFNRADALAQGGRRGTIGFALTVLQRRLASSPEAIYRSLTRRRERLEQRHRDARAALGAPTARTPGSPAEWALFDADADSSHLAGFIRRAAGRDPDAEEAWDDYSGAEREDLEDELVDKATAARSLEELAAEIESLRALEALAAEVRRRGEDRKWQELSRVLQDQEAMFDGEGHRRKLIVFTESRDTLTYLVERIRALVGRAEAVVAISGHTRREERRAIQERFTQDPAVLVLVATDAAGEGINLQRAHLMVNYDLPWNPNRLEQRFGRIHRIGQAEVCHLWNLVAQDTREGDVYLTLLQKLETAQKALGGAVFDVLGKALAEADLRRLLIDAVRYGDQPAVRARLTAAVAGKVDASRLAALVQDRALTDDLMNPELVQRVRRDMERALAQRLQPHYVSAFCRAMLAEAGGLCREREPGRYEVTHVPAAVRERARGPGAPVLPRYDRITFDKARVRPPGRSSAALVAPGHPLLDALVDLALARYRPLLARGAVLVDPADATEAPRLLVYLDHAIDEPTADGAPGRTISRRVQFVEVTADGTARPGGPAPYLDYRAATPNEREGLERDMEPWRTAAARDQAAVRYALAELVPEHLTAVRTRRAEWAAKSLQAVRQRLTHEIAYWDHRARQLAEDEARGKPNARLNAARATARAEALAARLAARTAELERVGQVTARPPVVIGAALVVPQGLLDARAGRGEDAARRARDTQRVEAAAMQAVAAAERHLGHCPRDVSRDKRGYDIESAAPDGTLRLLEVKGRVAGADTVTVTANEIRTALNRPEHFILALVAVPADGDIAPPAVHYVRQPFHAAPDFGVDSVNYHWRDLWQQGRPPS